MRKFSALLLALIVLVGAAGCDENPYAGEEEDAALATEACRSKGGIQEMHYTGRSNSWLENVVCKNGEVVVIKGEE